MFRDGREHVGTSVAGKEWTLWLEDAVGSEVFCKQPVKALPEQSQLF